MAKIAALKQQNDELRSEIAIKSVMIISANEQNEKLMQVHDEQRRNLLEQTIQELRAQNEDWKRKYDIINERNIKLNDECKQLEMRLQEITNKYGDLVGKRKINERDYMHWNTDMIVDWIIGLDKEYERYKDVLRRNMQMEQVGGSLLCQLDKNDLHRLGVIILKHKIEIMGHIKRITSAQQSLPQHNKGGNDAVTEEGR